MGSNLPSGRMAIELLSFGFRYGAPDVADLQIDVRFLPNPNFEPELRERTGLEADVSAYVMERPPSKAFLARLVAASGDLGRSRTGLWRRAGVPVRPSRSQHLDHR